MTSTTPSVKLWNHFKMPLLGLGTWHHGPKEEIQNAIRYSLRNGYRLIDCAKIYKNETEVGEVFEEMLDKEIPRESVFIIGKLWCTDHDPEHVEEACRKSLADLKLDYFDAYLIHWPTSFKHGDNPLPEDGEGNVIVTDVPPIQTWKAMERLIDLGLVRSLGTSNFNSQQLTDIMQDARVKPAVNQVESNPRFQNEALRQWCRKNDIVFSAYSPLGSPDLPWGKKLPHILQDPLINRLAKKHNRSGAQVALRWQIERGVPITPKSIFEHELYDNLQIFTFSLDEDDMTALKTLETGERKIIPVKVLKNGETALRDAKSKYFPFNFTEKLE